MNNHGEQKLEAAKAFAIKGQIKSCDPYGSGHINLTFRLVCEENGQEYSYILQQMNHEVFKDIDGLMRNVGIFLSVFFTDQTKRFICIF